MWRIPTLCGGKLVFYKTNFSLNKIGFVICDKCNEEFYAPKVDFSYESYGQKRHSCSNYDYENIKDNVLHTNPVLRTTGWWGKS